MREWLHWYRKPKVVKYSLIFVITVMIVRFQCIWAPVGTMLSLPALFVPAKAFTKGLKQAASSLARV